MVHEADRDGPICAGPPWYRGEMDPDLVLLEQWRAGDRAAGEALFARHFDEVYRFLASKIGGEADDLVQRTFLACVRARHQFRGHSSFRTYLFTIARNELYSLLRGTQVARIIDFDVTSIAEIATSMNSRIAAAQDVALLRAALAELPAE